MQHKHWACALEPGSHNCWAHVLQLLTSLHPRAHALQQEKPQWEARTPQLERGPRLSQLEKSLCSNTDSAQPKINKVKNNQANKKILEQVTEDMERQWGC